MDWIKTHLLSRKYTITLIALALDLMGYLLTGIWQGLGNQFSTFTYGLIGLAAAYHTGNVMDTRLNPSPSLMANGNGNGPRDLIQKTLDNGKGPQAQTEEEGS